MNLRFDVTFAYDRGLVPNVIERFDTYPEAEQYIERQTDRGEYAIRKVWVIS